MRCRHVTEQESSMPRGLAIVVLTLLISVLIIHVALWIRGIRPSRRTSLWEHLTWEAFPRDDQQRQYLKQRLLTAIVVLPIVTFVVHAVFE
ncbi:hypothetical protein XH79_11460 [Bradyrhizobium sp. CCBAU 45389]|nr:hypothetical protein [Bradyrhizobium sp. CCBAU 45389]